MNKLRLFAAVLAAVKAHFDNNTAFSALDITEFIQDKVDTGEWEVMNFNFTAPKVIKHESVKVYVEDLFRQGLFYGRVDRSYETNSFGNTYKLYTPVEDKDCASDKCEAKPGDFKSDVAKFVDGAGATCKSASDDDFDEFDDLVDSISEDVSEDDTFSISQTTKVRIDGVDIVIDKDSVTIYSTTGQSRRIDLV